ncbi:hypothetical protein GOP47_0005708 [Adiantum capillus-veneris]|uniref:Dof-type domain-containing protein n=1 Tax=Adiantum capillus-veneris TaxID=13818 RepID=A0A9D4ZLU5_ADICA|nr:hypothetical protein GOP47_0005708 [Adiantum capillus-veneris]
MSTDSTSACNQQLIVHAGNPNRRSRALRKTSPDSDSSNEDEETRRHFKNLHPRCSFCRDNVTNFRYFNNMRKAGCGQPRYHCNACGKDFTWHGKCSKSTISTRAAPIQYSKADRLQLSTGRKSVSRVVTGRAAEAPESCHQQENLQDNSSVYDESRSMECASLMSLDDEQSEHVYESGEELMSLSESSVECALMSLDDGIYTVGLDTFNEIMKRTYMQQPEFDPFNCTNIDPQYHQCLSIIDQFIYCSRVS